VLFRGIIIFMATLNNATLLTVHRRHYDSYAYIMGAPREITGSSYARRGTLRYTVSQKHQSTYLHNRETKLGINDSTCSLSEPLSISVTAVFISH
jgi:hypothetical protein